VLVTGSGQMISPGECTARGAAGVLCKPYTLEELTTAVLDASAPAQEAA
jgi:CheY-like chemotaxis protein